MGRIKNRGANDKRVRFLVLFLLSLLILNAMGAILRVDLIQTAQAAPNGALIQQDVPGSYDYYVDNGDLLWEWDRRYPGISYGGQMSLSSQPGNDFAAEDEGCW